MISFMKYIGSPFVCDDLGKVLLEGRAEEPNEFETLTFHKSYS